ncbi:Tn3 family transposase [Streptomyces sp. JV190]|nr:Tn3 family transposase [Streptomyces sp. JV190]MEE1844033.1 Tn3 family transposase [Streptomyces sp. JV190]
MCHGKRGHIQQAYKDGQEDQLASLGLVLNAVVLWNTRYLDAAVEQLRALPADQREHDVLDEDVARLSPLKAGHLNVLGRYAFTPSQPEGALRPLRDPDAVDDDDQDDE